MQAKFLADQKTAEDKRTKKVDKKQGFEFVDYENEAYEEEISIKRIENTRKEYNMLQFNITASAILFKEI